MTERPTRGAGPLDGLLVLDFSRVLSGPHCGRMLADMGADVIKVEPPEGDMTRYSFPRVNSIATYFTQQNCGKRNISLDLKQPRAVALLHTMARRVDVVLENFRPGVMDRMGLGYDVLSAENPRLVYASITGYGQSGPWSDRRAYAPVVGAESGLTWLQGMARGGAFANDVISHGDVYASLECLAGILAALVQRDRTGRGQHVDVSMTGTLLSINEHVHWELSEIEADGVVPSFSPGDYPVLTVADGRTVIVSGHPADRGTFERYADGVGRPDLIADPRFVDVALRLQHFDELLDELQPASATFEDPETLEAALAEHGLAMGVLRSVREVADSDWAREREAIVEVPDRGGGTIRIPNSPVAVQRCRRRGAGPARLPRRAQPRGARRAVRPGRRGARCPGGGRRAVQPAARPPLSTPGISRMLHFPVAPMKAVSGTLPHEDDGWAYELKWDGYRTIAFLDGDRTRLQSTTFRDVSAKYPELAGLAEGLDGVEGHRRRRGGGAHTRGRAPLRAAPAPRRPGGLRRLRPAVAGRRGPRRPPVRGAPRALLLERFRPGPGRIVPRHQVGDGEVLLQVTSERGPRGHHGQAPRQPLRARQALAELAQGQAPAAAGGGDRWLHGRRRQPHRARSARCWSATTRTTGCASAAASAPGSTRRCWSR